MTEAKVKRSQIRTYLDVDPGYQDWVQIGTGARSSTINMNPDVSDEHYIDQDSGTKQVEGYAPEQDVDYIAINGNEIFEFIDGLQRSRAILEDAETQIVNVWMYETAVDGAYPAELQDVAISVNSKGGDGGKVAEIPYTIHYQGDPIVGTFNPSTLVFNAS